MVTFEGVFSKRWMDNGRVADGKKAGLTACETDWLWTVFGDERNTVSRKTES